MQNDKKMIVRALKLWFQPGDVFEIRVLDAVSAEWMRPHMESGYFDYAHIESAAEAIARLRSYRGAYATVNPVNPDLLARACNRIRAITREAATADTDIMSRRWLLIDCDPKRASGISSSDEEHDDALSMACKIRDGLAASGWPAPILQDSGNGAQMMYRVDLPLDDGGLLQRCIEGIATAGDERVDVDLTVFNPARIWRIPGTMNCKGDDVPTRPHRMAQILSVPDKTGVVTVEQLEQAAAWKNTAQPVKGSTYVSENDTSAFDLDAWIEKYCPELGQPQIWKDGRKWVFPVCPFNDAHRNRSAVLIQHSNGAIAFRCHHNSCTGNDWRRLRELREPGCYDHPEEQPRPDVDISGILNQKPKAQPSTQKTEKSAVAFQDPGPMPKHLLHIPGFIDDYIKWAEERAPHPNREVEFCAAVSFLSYVAGRKVIGDRNTMPNIYLIVLGDSGIGKDQPRKTNMEAAIECGLGDGVIEDFTSGGGIEDMLYLNPTLLLQKDEIDTLFNILKNSKDANTETILEKLLRIYGSSNGVWKMRCKALARGDLMKLRQDKQNGLNMSNQTIHYPYLTIFGTAIPEFFYNSLSQRVLANGLAARCMVIVASGRSPTQRSKIISMPEHLRKIVNIIQDYTSNGGNLCDIHPQLKVIHATPEADKMLDDLSEHFETLYHQYEAMRSHVAMSFWARALEKVLKLVLLYALSENPKEPVVSCDAVRWASEFVEYVTKQALFLASEYSYENPFDEKAQKVIRALREAKRPVSRSELMNRIRESKEVFDKIIDTLIENETVAVVYEPTEGRTKRMYQLIDGK